MIKTNLLTNTEHKYIKEQKGVFTVLEYIRDRSIDADRAIKAFFESKMNVRKRQLVAELNGEKGVYIQAGEMQMMLGGLEAATNLKGVGDLFKKLMRGTVTGESAVKPYYSGEGTLVFEPTFMHILLLDMKDWEGDAVIEDGMFLACEDTVELELDRRKNASSFILGNEGIFNTKLTGEGIVALECPIPLEEILEIEMEDDVVKLDGDMAMVWSSTLNFTVEKTTSTVLGSVASGEGFVNVYRGTGKILVAPIRDNYGIATPDDEE
ncbi:MAG: AIM24 family protein [Lachnospiraceae bacterium]|nr:AIM24 family protein [Lachnospiraceae bacterium]